MNKDELTRYHLDTVLRMAVRLGRLSVPDHAMAAELRDLAQLYLDATGNPMAWEARRFHRQLADPFEMDASPIDAPAVCGFEAPMPDDEGHTHHCNKAPGHADGPGGSDHQCEWCGVLYDEEGRTASPVGMGSLRIPNGPADEAEEIEL